MNTTPSTATSTNLISFTREGGRRRMLEIIPRLAGYGYRRLDLNFCEMMNPASDIDEEYIASLKRLGKDLGLEYVQSHVPYPRDWTALDEAEREASDALVADAIRYSVSLSIPAIVIHPIRGGVKENVDYLRRFLPLVSGTGCRLAVENMESEAEVSTPDQLIAIVQELGDDAGICLDTGHAHMRGLDIPGAIRSFGDLLIATHIADNHGEKDEHLLPFFGTIAWEEVMKAFSDIGYKGALTYECMFFTRHLPRSLEEDVVALSLHIARVLEGMMG